MGALRAADERPCSGVCNPHAGRGLTPSTRRLHRAHCAGRGPVGAGLPGPWKPRHAAVVTSFPQRLPRPGCWPGCPAGQSRRVSLKGSPVCTSPGWAEPLSRSQASVLGAVGSLRPLFVLRNVGAARAAASAAAPRPARRRPSPAPSLPAPRRGHRGGAAQTPGRRADTAFPPGEPCMQRAPALRSRTTHGKAVLHAFLAAVTSGDLCALAFFNRGLFSLICPLH